MWCTFHVCTGSASAAGNGHRSAPRFGVVKVYLPAIDLELGRINDEALIDIAQGFVRTTATDRLTEPQERAADSVGTSARSARRARAANPISAP